MCIPVRVHIQCIILYTVYVHYNIYYTHRVVGSEAVCCVACGSSRSGSRDDTAAHTSSPPDRDPIGICTAAC